MLETIRMGELSWGRTSTGGNMSAGFGYGFSVVQNPLWSVAQVLVATGGKFLGGNPMVKFRCVSTDTRTLQPGDLFVALKGESFDGLSYIHEAVRKGAGGIVVATKPKKKLPCVVVQVGDTLKALGDLAHYRRQLMPGLRVLAITGSSGKTTVKEMVSSILSRKFKVLKTKGNYNNLIGLPLSLLEVDSQHDFAVLELGMNSPGEIARLTKIADPDIACIINVQAAHLEGLGSLDGVARAKGELYQETKPWGRLVVNRDDSKARKQARRTRQPQITFGFSKEAYVRGTRIHQAGANGTQFTLQLGDKKKRLGLQCFGRHNVANALAAAALAYAAGADFVDIIAGLEAYQPFEKRFAVSRTPNGIHIINDTYNANPGSMKAALETLHNLKQDAGSFAVLGDMLELGAHSTEEHLKLGGLAAKIGIDGLLTLGDFGATVVQGAIAGGLPSAKACNFDTKQNLIKHFNKMMRKGEIQKGDWVLVKGSRGMKMEEVVSAIAGEDK